MRICWAASRAVPHGACAHQALATYKPWRVRHNSIGVAQALTALPLLWGVTEPSPPPRAVADVFSLSRIPNEHGATGS